MMKAFALIALTGLVSNQLPALCFPQISDSRPPGSSSPHYNLIADLPEKEKLESEQLTADQYWQAAQRYKRKKKYGKAIEDLNCAIKEKSREQNGLGTKITKFQLYSELAKISAKQ